MCASPGINGSSTISMVYFDYPFLTPKFPPINFTANSWGIVERISREVLCLYMLVLFENSLLTPVRISIWYAGDLFSSYFPRSIGG